MTINYPKEIDSNENLYLVHDALRVKLVEDYLPGDTTIYISGDTSILLRFPENGIITLTEQVSNIDERAISFSYSSRTDTTFDGLVLLPGFTDSPKPKNITNVTQNVMAEHHNNLKDALIAIEEFIGVKGTLDTKPLGNTIEGRLNFLRKLVFTPRAWFTVDKTIGIIPLQVTFTDRSFRLGEGKVSFLWDFGDDTFSNISNISNISTISLTSVVPLDISNVLVDDVDGNSIIKTYTQPKKYTVKLTVKNEFGEDTVEFPDLINARIEAPNEAKVEFITRVGQIVDNGPPPSIRSSVNTFIDLQIPEGIDLDDSNRSNAGELLEAGIPIDPIVNYKWSLSDDLAHANSSTARALYSIGGIYDLKVRADTAFSSYRITTYENAIDIVEKNNLWLWTFGTGNQVVSNEFGLISETFKTSRNTLSITRNDSFLNGTANESQAKQEFRRNTGFTKRGTIASGDRGTSMLFWASGGPLSGPLLNHEVKTIEYNGFTDAYVSQPSIPNRPWNWLFLSSGTDCYFAFGQDPSVPVPNSNPSYQVKSKLSLNSLAITNSTFNSGNYVNGADELKQHVSSYDGDGNPTNGRFAVYRTAWKDQTGYIVRNDGVGANFFRLRSFYKTEGTFAEPFTNIKKITSMLGTKLEGQLVNLESGLFFFNNSGSYSFYDDTSGVWKTGSPSANSSSFRSMQDTSVSNFDDPKNALLATSDGDRTTYLSFDYSPNAFIKFNAQDSTFTNLKGRPAGVQWMMGIY